MEVVRNYTALLSEQAIHDSYGKAAFYTFSFPTFAPAHHQAIASPDGLSSFRPFTEAEKSAARAAINAFGAVSGLTFFEVSPQSGDILFAAYDLSLTNFEGFGGYAYYPSGAFDRPINSDIFMDHAFAGDRHLLLHEIGHALGLKHSFEGWRVLAEDLDHYGQTVMSYTAGGFAGDVLGPLDKQAIQYLYGDAGADGSQVASWSWDAGTSTLTQTGFEIDDKIFGTGAIDIVQALAGNDHLYGRGGNDRLDGGAGDDTIDSGDGDDTIVGGLGHDQISGGPGDDSLGGDAGDDRLGGGEGNDMLSGGAGDDLIGGGDGHDRLLGGDNNDILRGSAGDDYLDGGAGADTMDGDIGNDTYIVDSDSDTVEGLYFNPGGRDTVRTSLSYSLPKYIEDLVLTGTSPVTGKGNALANGMTGNYGANQLRGLGGNDVLKGGGRADTLEGGPGADWLYGGSGNDKLKGDDTAANRGLDRFYFDTRPNASSNRDTILDFNPADDSIYLARSIFTGFAATGRLSSATFAAGTAARDSLDRIIYNKSTGAIFYDLDGTGPAAPVWFASVAPGTNLTPADFIVY